MTLHLIFFFYDILIYSQTFEEHECHLNWVFQLLRDNQLHINKKKMHFWGPTNDKLGPYHFSD